VRILIVGCGLAGVSLAKAFQNKNISFDLYGSINDHCASKISSGIINPISGRNHVLSWNYERYVRAALSFYNDSKEYMKPMIIEKYISDAHAFKNLELEADEKSKWLEIIGDRTIQIKHAYQVDIPGFLNQVHQELLRSGNLKNERLDYAQLVFQDHSVLYQQMEYDFVIFAEGIEAIHNPYLKSIEFIPNRGDAMIIKTESVPREKIVHKGKFICPFSNETFWIGSSYDRIPFSVDPISPQNQQVLDAFANELLGSSYTLITRKAAFRSTTFDRRPYIGSLETHPNAFIFNGFGTKGASLIPYMAMTLVNHMISGEELPKEVNINRRKK
jgi:glycine/D-amino acid oxidase-like deaminating enzyme